VFALELRGDGVLGSTASVITAGGLLLRVGVGAIAAGVAAFAIGFAFCLWFTTDRVPADAGFRAAARAHSDFGTVDAKPAGLSATAARSDISVSLDARSANLEAASAAERDDQGKPGSAQPSFAERFSFKQPDASSRALQRSASFDDRFAGEFVASAAPARSAAAPPGATTKRVAAATTPRAAARSVVAQVAPKRPQGARFQLASASDTALPLAYAPADSVTGSAVTGPALKDLTPKASKPLTDVVTSRTAIYDITSQTVHLPNGRRLEAHSGLGGNMDDPRYVSASNIGPTPPNVYDLKLREAPFHGVRAIRLIPTDESKMYGRSGILAHSYMLGPSGQSNGCVSFSDYPAFLDAFLRGEVDRLVVVERLANPPSPRTASDWFKDLFRRS
jgi:hypothetical protein